MILNITTGQSGTDFSGGSEPTIAKPPSENTKPQYEQGEADGRTGGAPVLP